VSATPPLEFALEAFLEEFILTTSNLQFSNCAARHTAASSSCRGGPVLLEAPSGVRAYLELGF